MVATSSVSSNPDNPSGRVADVESLIESVREVGVLQPLLLAPSGAFGLAHPEHVEAVQKFEWVILAGHRRHVAAIGAGLAEVPAVVREDLSRDGRDDEVLLHENLHRKELTPLEEARGYGRMASRGLSQRAIARHTGISQGQIAKRMSLLRLVPEVQDAVDTDKLVVIEALSWAKEPEDVQRAAWEMLRDSEAGPRQDPSRLLQAAKRQLAEQARLAAAEAMAAEMGVSVYQGPSSGGSRRVRPVVDPDEVDAAKERGDLFVEPGGERDEPALVTTYQSEAEPVSDYEQRQKTAERERKLSIKAREESLGRMAHLSPSAKDVADALVHMTLAGGGLGSSVTTRARKLARQAGIGPVGESDWDWRDQLKSAKTGRGRLGWLIYLAWMEEMARTDHRSWDSDQVAYMELLTTKAGHVTTAWEQQRLDEAVAGLSNEPADSVDGAGS